MQPPAHPKIYHIVHVDRLASIVRDGYLWCDKEVGKRAPGGTAISMEKIKRLRRENLLCSHPDLQVGDCVPFYFCPRSVMLFVIFKQEHQELSYWGGQGPIVHLEADLRQTVAWADEQKLRWAFTLSNAGSLRFEDRCDLANLGEINWEAVRAKLVAGEQGGWREYKEGKQAEFLIERQFPWNLILRIGVRSEQMRSRAMIAIEAARHKPRVETKPDWYY